MSLFKSIFEKYLSTGVVTSPNYCKTIPTRQETAGESVRSDDCNYPNGLQLTKTIETEEGMLLLLEFTGFNTERRFDHLTIVDGDGTILMKEIWGLSLIHI